MSRKGILHNITTKSRRKYIIMILLLSLLLWCGYSTVDFNPEHFLKNKLEEKFQNRNLESLMNQTKLIIEPSYKDVCSPLKMTPIVIFVTSAAENFQHRSVIRSTWGSYQPTFFVIGMFKGMVDAPGLTEVFFHDNNVEADQHKDVLLFDLEDDENSLSLKTGLIIKWTVERCPHVKFIMKTEDDVLINPRTLKKVYTENHDAQLLGYVNNNTTVGREMFKPHFAPRWLYKSDIVPQHLDGAAYIIKVEYLQKILKAANEVPLMNLEYVYFTYLVAYKTLALKLRHDWRLSPSKPWCNISCAYHHLATSHSYTAYEMEGAWPIIKGLLKENNTTDCSPMIPFLLATKWLLL